jgi:hypothetical protein
MPNLEDELWISAHKLDKLMRIWEKTRHLRSRAQKNSNSYGKR